ncbi:unnamed protein product [Calypogeia fissa]
MQPESPGLLFQWVVPVSLCVTERRPEGFTNCYYPYNHSMGLLLFYSLPGQRVIGYGLYLGSMLIGVIMPYFLLSLPPFIYILFHCQPQYAAVSRELKRLDGLSRSPIFAHFMQTLQGVTSVRAYGLEKVMHDHFAELMDANNCAYIMVVHTACWLGVRLDFGAACCLMTAALVSVLLRHTLNPGYIGVALIQSLQLTGFFQYGIRLLADMENLFTSVERNQAYSRLPSEANPKSPPGLITYKINKF